MSALMQAEVEGQRLTPAEFGSFFILLAVAGNETTRNAISWGMKLLTDHPDQRRLWMDDVAGRTPDAIEEIVRWGSPVIHMRRTALEDTRIGDTEIAAGDKVVMWYWSANRDESVFDDGHTFDITRPNAKAQLGYGAGGPHFCLGANLARREITMMFQEIFQWLPDLRDHERAGPPAVAVHQRHQAHGLRVHPDHRPRPLRSMTMQPPPAPPSCGASTSPGRSRRSTSTDPKRGEVLVRWKAAGLCHSDEHLVTGDMVPSPEMLEADGARQLLPDHRRPRGRRHHRGRRPRGALGRRSATTCRRASCRRAATAATARPGAATCATPAPARSAAG